jgi:hypothetical protein
VENERPELILHSERENNKAMDKNQQVLSTAFLTPEFDSNRFMEIFQHPQDLRFGLHPFVERTKGTSLDERNKISSEKYILISAGRFTS